MSLPGNPIVEQIERLAAEIRESEEQALLDYLGASDVDEAIERMRALREVGYRVEIGRSDGDFTFGPSGVDVHYRQTLTFRLTEETS